MTSIELIVELEKRGHEYLSQMRIPKAGNWGKLLDSESTTSIWPQLCHLESNYGSSKNYQLVYSRVGISDNDDDDDDDDGYRANLRHFISFFVLSFKVAVYFFSRSERVREWRRRIASTWRKPRFNARRPSLPWIFTRKATKIFALDNSGPSRRSPLPTFSLSHAPDISKPLSQPQVQRVSKIGIKKAILSNRSVRSKPSFSTDI